MAAVGTANNAAHAGRPSAAPRLGARRRAQAELAGLAGRLGGYAALADRLQISTAASPTAPPPTSDADGGLIEDPLEDDEPEPGPTFPPVCMQYRLHAWRAPPSIGECGGRWDEQPPIDFAACLSIRPEDAVEWLRGEFGGSAWEEELWAAVGLDRWLDRSVSRDSLRANLDDDDWETWDSDAFGHAPFEPPAPAPRARLLLMTMWLVCSLDKGVPATLDGVQVRSQIVDPLLRGEMKFRTYGPNRGTADGAFEALRAHNCRGPSQQRFLGVQSTVGCTPAGSPPCDACDPSECLAQETMNLFDEIQFLFSHLGFIGEVTSANNHSVVGSRVYVCEISLDKLALTYDWLLGRAAAHFYTFLNASDPAQMVRHHAAASICLRMALGVAVRFATVVVHEVAHNISLSHCAQHDGTKAGCVQDVATNAWQVYAMARLGLPRVRVDNESAIPGVLIQWQPDLALPARDVVLSPPGGALLPPQAVLTRRDAIECQQGQEVSDAAETALDVTSGILTWSGVAVGALGALTGGLGGVLVGAVSAVIGVAVGEITDRVTDDIDPETFARFDFDIDTPLQPGGHVYTCCVYGRNRGRTLCAPIGASQTPCWQTDLPEGFLSCCEPEFGRSVGAALGGAGVVGTAGLGVPGVGP